MVSDSGLSKDESYTNDYPLFKILDYAHLARNSSRAFFPTNFILMVGFKKLFLAR